MIARFSPSALPAKNALQMLRVGVVGLGGTGSAVAQQLAHLGVTKYTLIDRDDIDVTNLNRLIGARRRRHRKDEGQRCPSNDLDHLS